MFTVTRNEKGQAVGFDEATKAAMHRIEDLINAGDLVLGPDEWLGGRQMFRQSRHVRTEPTVDVRSAKLGKLMIISTPRQLTAVLRAELLSHYQSAADHIGAHLVLLDGGTTAAVV